MCIYIYIFDVYHVTCIHHVHSYLLVVEEGMQRADLYS